MFGQINNDYTEYGSWAEFVANEGPLKGKSVYFDGNGNEFLAGTGPIQDLMKNKTQPLLTSGGQSETVGGGIVGQFASQLMPTQTTVTAYIPGTVTNVSTSAVTPVSQGISRILEVLETPSFFGIPNWMLAMGGVGAYMFLSGHHKGRR